MEKEKGFDWCVEALAKNLLATNWFFETKREYLPNKLPTHWLINKDAHQLELKFYWNVYEGVSYGGACHILGTSIALDFLEIHQKDIWLETLECFIEKLNNNFKLIDFGGYLLENMTSEQGLEIAQTYIDKREGMNARITNQTQFMTKWYTLDHPVWIIFAENLNKGPIIDGTNTYSIIVSIITRKVEYMELC